MPGQAEVSRVAVRCAASDAAMRGKINRPE
ncbi:hypothetical protein DO72_5870 [Burkholderia pseudomallei]|nr:hypothetical protein DO72_5862 [Burkholderia pseudomallei]KGD34611.1 hypothetical protein DO72_5870 [Burkholderia pseudomallei]